MKNKLEHQTKPVCQSFLCSSWTWYNFHVSSWLIYRDSSTSFHDLLHVSKVISQWWIPRHWKLKMIGNTLKQRLSRKSLFKWEERCLMFMYPWYAVVWYNELGNWYQIEGMVWIDLKQKWKVLGSEGWLLVVEKNCNVNENASHFSC